MKEKNKRTNTDLGQLQTQKWEEVCDTFCASCELTRACTRAKTLTKPLTMRTYLLCIAFIAVDCLPCCSLLLTASFLLSDLPFLVHFRSRGRSRAQAISVGFAPKQTNGFSDWHPRTHPHNECPTSYHMLLKEEPPTKPIIHIYKVNANINMLKDYNLTMVDMP